MSKKNSNTRGDNFTILIWIVGCLFFLSLFFLNKNTKKQEVNENQEIVKDLNNQKYSIIFSNNFNVSIANQDDLGLSIVIAVDCSGSMGDSPASGGDKKYLQSSKSVKGILIFIKDFYKNKLINQKIKLNLALVTFSDIPKILYDMTEVDLVKIDEMISFCENANNFKPRGYTAIGDTIIKSTELLMQSGTIFKSLIIVTDGENTSGADPLDVLEAVYNNRNNKSNDEFPVITNSILVNFILFDIDENKFNTFKNFGVGLTEASEGKEIEETLKKLFLTDITKLESL